MTENPNLGVCVVTHPLAPASEAHVHALLNVFASITTVSLITANLNDKSEIRNKYDVIDISGSGTGTNIIIAAFRFILNQLRMCLAIWQRDGDIVLFFGATSYLLPIVFARLIGKTVVLEPRGDVPLTLRLQWEQRLPGILARLLAGSVSLLEAIGYCLCDAIITYTPSMAEELGLDRFEQKLYPYGARYIDLDRFYPYRSFTERDRVVGFLGRLDEEKGIETLVSVAERLPPDIRFRFIGDGARREWLEAELADEIAAGDIDVTGWVDHKEVPAELSELQLLVMPSAPTEGLPTTILEAMACGTPVYATPVSGVPSVIQEGETGFLMADTDPDTVATTIKSILRESNLEALSDDARQLIEDEYSFEAAVERYRSILIDISPS